jgi:hypothetical protein
MSYYGDCPKYIEGCTIDDIYLYTFGDCTDTDRILACFELRLRTCLDLIVRGLPIDQGHIHAIDLAAFYYAKCLVTSRGYKLDEAIRLADFVYQNALSNHRVVSSLPLFTTLVINRLFELSPMSERCKEALRRAKEALNKEIDQSHK